MTRKFQIAVLVFLLAACSAPQSSPPTSQPQETIAQSTSTSEPTADAALTEEAAVVGLMDVIEADLALAGYSTLVTQGQLAWIQTEPIHAFVDDEGQWDNHPLADPNPAFVNFILGVDIQWESGDEGLNGCDIYFRSEPDLANGRQVFLELFRSGGIYEYKWDISIADDGAFVEFIDSQLPVTSIDQTSASTNHYLLVVDGQDVTFYANGLLHGTAELDPSFASGVVGFAAWQYLGPTTTCSFSNGWVWELP